jgi:TrmH family RNA methyltransferase
MMISKIKLKELAAYRQQKRCDADGVFVVEGPKMCAEALASGYVVRTVCATADWLAAHAEELGTAAVLEVSPADLERLSNFKTPNQVWMLVERHSPLSTLRSPLTLALDHLQDPGNMGTIMRTADWFGVRHIVCSADTVSCFNPKVVQASMGAVFRTQVEYVDLPQWLAGCGMPVYGASLQGRPLDRAALPDGPSVLLIGNESRGIGPAAMAQVSHPILIPNRGGTAESLNAAVAAGILLNAFTQ